MDPAGPFYEGSDERVRLNPSDAKFVDVIHSNGKPITSAGAGMFASCGHVDFYPNGGKSQPGCPDFYSNVWKTILRLDFSGKIYGCTTSSIIARYHMLYSVPLSKYVYGL